MRVSIVVVAYNMERELPRTLRSLSPRMQSGIDDIDYEIIVVDNGSDTPLDLGADAGWVRLVRIDDALTSPVEAINHGIDIASGDLVGVMIDGARLASPGIVSGAVQAARLHERPIIATIGFHLGADVQMRTVGHGYDQRAEDLMLEAVGWESDGYRLFDISVFARSSAGGWFSPIAESNALFMPASMWEELGGFDSRFSSPGGGLVNLDTFVRACSLPHSCLIVLLGEGTFHQVHGGVATNTEVSRWGNLHTEYKEIRGHAFAEPQVEPLFLGSIPRSAVPHVHRSAALSLSLDCSR